jgi:hypothetical protein
MNIVSINRNKNHQKQVPDEFLAPFLSDNNAALNAFGNRMTLGINMNTWRVHPGLLQVDQVSEANVATYTRRQYVQGDV